MPENADQGIELIPNLHDILLNDIPVAVLKSVIDRLGAVGRADCSVSAFQNFVGTGHDELIQAA